MTEAEATIGHTLNILAVFLNAPSVFGVRFPSVLRERGGRGSLVVHVPNDCN